ncbi:MAG TPA: aminotransferase [Acidimicrobiaceae bacterium]|nr:aminotransferase [Acidimicrobiaceae bacterium]
MKRALVIEHDESGPAAGVGERLVEHGYQLDVFRVLDDQADPVCTKAYPDATSYDVLVVTGSPWSVTDTDSIGSWIGREIEMVRTAHDAGVAVLGLCFGGQVLSTALGGEVRRVDTPEFGWHEVDTDLPDAIAPGPWFEWHYDGFTVPDGATEIARTAVSPQAFRIGRSVGTQFHPEITTEIVNLWISMDERALRAHGVDPAVMAARTEEEAVDNRARSDALVDWFLDGD